MIQNKYILSLEKELKSHLHSSIDNDRSEILNKNLEYGPYQNTLDIFNTFINVFQYKPEDIISILYQHNERSYFSDLFEHYHYLNSSKREIFEIFKPVLNSNNIFFKDLFLRFKSHREIEHLSETQNSIIINENFELFKELVQIGKDNNYFNQYNEDDFYFTYKPYLNYLIDENVFKNNFDIEKLYDYLDNIKNKKSIKNYHNKSQDNNFIHTYLNDIIQSYKNNPEFIQTIIDRNLEEVFIEQLFLTSYKKSDIDITPENEQKLNSLVLGLLNNSIYRNIIFKNTTELMAILLLTDYSIAFKEYLENIPNKDKYDIFSLTKYVSKYDDNTLNIEFLSNSYYKTNDILNIFHVISKWNERFNNHKLNEELLNLFVDEVLERNSFTHEQKENANLYVSSWLLKLYDKCNNISLIKQNSFYSQTKKEILNKDENKTLKKYSHLLTHFFKIDDKNNVVKSQLIQDIISYIPEIFGDNLENFKKKINTNIQTAIYHQVYEHYTQKNIQSYSSILKKNDIQNISQLLTIFKDIPILDILDTDIEKPLWKECILDFPIIVHTKNIKGTKSLDKTIYDFPFAFSMIHASKGNNFEFFINSESRVDNLASIKFKGKGLISALNSTQFSHKYLASLITKLSDYPYAFKKIVLSNKAAVKIINELSAENEFSSLKTLLTYQKLNDKININIEEKIQQPKRKI